MAPGKQISGLVLWDRLPSGLFDGAIAMEWPLSSPLYLVSKVTKL